MKKNFTNNIRFIINDGYTIAMCLLLGTNEVTSVENLHHHMCSWFNKNFQGSSTIKRLEELQQRKVIDVKENYIELLDEDVFELLMFNYKNT